MVRVFSSVTAQDAMSGTALTALGVAIPEPIIGIAVAGLAALGLSIANVTRRGRAGGDPRRPAASETGASGPPADAERTDSILDEQNRLMRSAVDQMRIGIIVFDKDLRLVTCNQRYLEIYGLPADVATSWLGVSDIIRLNFRNAGFSGDENDYLSNALDDIAAGRHVQKNIELPNGRVLAIVNSPLVGGGRLSTHEDITNRRRNDLQMQEQKRQINIALENMSQGLVMYDENLRLIVCNRRYREMYHLAPEQAQPGFTLQDMLKHHFGTATLFGDAEVYAAELARKLELESTVTEVIDAAEGRTYSVTTRLLEGGGRIVTHDDITERHRLYKANLQVEASLRERKQQLDAAMNNMSQGLIMFDASGQVVVVNQRFLELYNLSSDVAKPGCSLIELMRHRKDVGILKGDPDEFAREILSSVRTHSERNFINVGFDGRMIRAQNRPMPGGGWVTTHEDITASQIAADKLHDQTTRLDAALNNMNQGLTMYDVDGRLVVFNKRYIEIYGLALDSLRPGMTLIEVLRMRQAGGTFARDPDGYAAKLMESIRCDKVFKLTTVPGNGRTVAITNVPMSGGGWVSTHEDVTQQRAAEEQVRLQKLQLDTALNSMTQGLNLFDRDGRLIVCNERYREMYRLPPEAVRPGVTIDDLVQARLAAGTFFESDPKHYKTELTACLASNEPSSFTRDLTDGRVVSVIGQPTADGNGWVMTHEDITDRRRIERERDRSQAFATSVIENVPSTIIVRDAKTRRYVLINRAGEAYFKRPREHIIGKTVYDLLPTSVAERIEEYDNAQLLAQKPILIDEHPSLTPDGEARIVSTTRVPIRDPEGKVQYLLSVIEDRTNRKRAEAQIAHLAHHDLLTGLPNRGSCATCIESTIEQCAGESGSFAVMSVNVDRFKEINEVYGHATGDRLLCEIARRLQASVGGAFVSRLGGDEFVVIDTDGVQPAAAHALADRITKAMEADFDLDGHTIESSVSIGVAIFPENGTDLTALTGNADAALHRAKSEGRGLFRFFEAAMDERLREQRLLLQDLRVAVEENQFRLHYQPQATIEGEVVGFEALARWTHPTRGFVSPGTFIPIAEESGLIIPFGEKILREACREAASWPKPLNIAVNLSPIQFTQSDVPALVHSVLLETGLAPSRLELEITEGVLIGDFSRALSILRRLKALGVRMAMDDFGTGYSSLSYLQSFPFDKIKIDQTFISNLETTPQSKTIVRAVIGLARGLGVPVIAEGVETKEQLAFLAAERCDEVQGYLIGRPQPIESYDSITGRPAATVSRSAAR